MKSEVFGTILVLNVVSIEALTEINSEVGNCPQGWQDVSPYGCFLADTTNLRDFFLSMEYCNDKGGYMVEFLTQVAIDLQNNNQNINKRMLKELFTQ